jgi:DNA-binding SARP family transcriptional activator/TolB-like protein/Flp pilus assembly protein TadD
MTQRPILQMQLLGRFGVVDLDGRPIQLRTRKAGALLAFLGMSRDFMASREELAGLFWGGCSDQQAKQSLRQALAMVRKAIGNPEALTADARNARLEPSFWSIDARDFFSLAHSTKREDLARAASLFAGNFMSDTNLDEEPFEEWVRGQRTRLQAAAGQLCQTLVDKPDSVTDSNQAVTTVEQLLALDPLREDWQRFAIALTARYRGRNEAIARAGSFADLLQRELGVGLEQETRALLDSIRNEGAVSARTASLSHDGNTGSAAVSDGANQAPLPPPNIAPAPPALAAATPGRRGGSLARAAVIAAVLLPAATLLGAYAWPGRPIDWSGRANPTPSSMSIAEPYKKQGLVSLVVMPFANLGDHSVALAADMLTDDLTNRLSRVPSFRVISRQTARSYHDQVDIAKIGSELQVEYVLEGSLRLQDGNLRVNVELIDPASRSSVWSGRVDRSTPDRQGVLDEIVGQLARELQFEVQPIQSLRLSNDVNADALAYRGWAAMSQISLAGYKQGVALFEEALQRDPTDLSAQTGLGAYHARMGAQVLDTDSLGHRAKAEEILRQVLQRAPDSSVAHFYLGLALNRLPTLPEALTHLEEAIRIDPSDSSAHAQIGNALIRSDRPLEGLEHVRYAMRLSPRDPVMPVWLEFAGNGELELKNYSEAITLFERAIALSPGYPRGWAGLVAAQALAGNMEEAHRVAVKLRSFAPTLDNDELLKQFGRHDSSKLHDGLTLAFAAEPPSKR